MHRLTVSQIHHSKILLLLYLKVDIKEDSKWIKAQIEKLNEIKEDCDGEVSK